MASVYRNARITLAATAFADGQGGLFQAFEPSTRFQHDRTIWDARFNTDPAKVLPSSPLNRRVWTLQEALLSPRLLHFTADQLYCECVSVKTSKDGLYRQRGPQPPKFPSDVSRGSEPPFEGIFTIRATLRAVPVQEFLRHDGLYNSWGVLMDDYSSRKLTYDKDKLIALAGIFEYF
jgi:hypothetical protein